MTFGMTNPNQKPRHWRIALKVLGGGLLLACLFSSTRLLLDLENYASSADTFRRIELGMSRQQVNSILVQDDRGYKCAASGTAEGTVCRFADFWRVYEIVFDRSTDQVVEIRFYFKKRSAAGGAD